MLLQCDKWRTLRTRVQASFILRLAVFLSQPCHSKQGMYGMLYCCVSPRRTSLLTVYQKTVSSIKLVPLAAQLSYLSNTKAYLYTRTTRARTHAHIGTAAFYRVFSSCTGVNGISQIRRLTKVVLDLMPKRKNECHFCRLVQAYDTCENDEIKEEIDIIVKTYENVRVSGKSVAHYRVLVPLASEGRPSRRVTLEIRVVPGYPYVAPAVNLLFPPGVQPGCEGTLSEHEVKQVAKEVLNNIQPCLPSGMPCMMQIVSTVAAIVECGLDPPSQEQNGKAQGEPKTPNAGQSPSLTPVPLKAKEALKLSLFAFHLLKKCCHMKDPESNEEAASNFDWLVKYLLDSVSIFPEAARSFFPWNGISFSRAFSTNINGALALPPDQQGLPKWVWEDEGRNIRIQQGSEGRYRNEFIQQRLLGAGGFAPVYVCRKKIDGRLYAIKKIAMLESQSEKVLREVQTLASLNHKNIVRYYDAWVEDGCDEDLCEFVDNSAEDEENEIMPSGKMLSHRSDAGAHASSSSDTNRTSSLWSSSEEKSSSTYTSEEEDDDSRESCSESSDAPSDVKMREPKAIRPSMKFQTLYIQMELCSARSLRHLIDESDSSDSGGIFSSINGEKVAVSILRQLLSVIAHTHRERIVHRDLKPENVLFEMESKHESEAGTIRVADFGLARVMSGVKRITSVRDVDEMYTPTNMVSANYPTGNCGSVLYCAPEQEKGLEYDFKVDEFSIGMIAFEMWLAIAGKGFRERFTIMGEVWRTGRVPKWFSQWNPTMADIIENLLEPDPRRRTTCEAVLSTAELPGDPADLTSALDTVDRYGERIAGRIIQKIQRIGSDFRKPSRACRDDARFVGSSQCTDLVQAVQVIGMLHGAVPVALFDPTVAMNPKLNEMNVDWVVDSSGRSFAYPALPYFATASFLGMQENGSIGSFYQFYHRTRSYVIFTTPLPHCSTFNECVLEPLLSLCHLLAFTDTTEPVEVIVSHVHWLKTVFPTEVGTRSPPPALCHLRSEIRTADQVGQAISRITESLYTAGLPPCDERDEYVKKFTTAVVDVINMFAKHMNTHLALVMDPALQPSDVLVLGKALEMGIIFECRSTCGGVPLAFGCFLDNFTANCAVVNPDISAFSVVVDVQHLLDVGKHVQVTWRENLLLDGVAAKRHDLYSLTQLPHIVEAAIQLWKGNIRACIRADTDTRSLARALKAKQIRWLLVDGKRIVAVSTNQQSKVSGHGTDIPLDDLRQSVRSLSVKEKSSSSASIAVQFLSGKVDTRTADKIVELFYSMMTPPPSTVVVVNTDVKRIHECLEQLNESAPDSSLETLAEPTLARWIKANAATSSVVPVYSLTDGKIVFFVNYKRFKVSGKKNKPHGKSKQDCRTGYPSFAASE
ncbi:protein kinase, putative [Leishmania tarentolae]|uniref:Protein kinase, putative n=1 Tax=Leishmania tarentolae TaxID=5689 RepID=A0A640KBQ3_LEITA|nr:protein kinase, putative [Leishmania tarentolae]